MRILRLLRTGRGVVMGTLLDRAKQIITLSEDRTLRPIEATTDCARSALSAIRGEEPATRQEIKDCVPCALSAESALRVDDPRPDLADDSALWTCLLRLAFQWDGNDPRGLFGALFGVRCQGARLEWDGTKYLIRPGDGWDDDEAFHCDRDQRLVPHATALVRMLRAVAEGHETLDWWVRMECAGEDAGRSAHEVIAAPHLGVTS